MDWTTVTIGVLGTISLVDLLRVLLFRKSDRREKEAEANKTELEVARAANEILSQQLATSQETIRGKDEIIAKKDDLLEEKNKTIDELNSVITALFDDMCVHKGCRLRKPHQGRGKQWYEQYKDDPSLGCDYTSIDTLLKHDREMRNGANLRSKKPMLPEPEEATIVEEQ